MSEYKVEMIKAEIVAKQIPNEEEIEYKAVAGITEEELIERFTIGELRRECDRAE